MMTTIRNYAMNKSLNVPKINIQFVKDITNKLKKHCLNIKTLVRLVFVIMAAFFLLNFRIAIATGKSMEPTCSVANLQLLKRHGEIKQGDIIAVKLDKDNEEYLEAYEAYGRKLTKDEHIVKRVIACPGDDISVKNNLLYINGELIDTPYWTGNWMPIECEFTYEAKNIPGYWIIGDNRPVSFDSRAFGYVSEDEVEGIFILHSTNVILNTGLEILTDFLPWT